ncbi:tyrosine--tRNA ligase [Fimbriimonas ginsengisoli]|uniref:Tyrosine--tRNA ligase n=1 Tax=Fimbriimonas ginsengisoli Gsoil 348 TaxID=661478 RepID=A0A068NPH8_FIMGI|nr:tyrosine--tRNA ligase [Fimbriimonas ginsengisoli]AIE85282.1 tyrosyl-tRNA synthetase [Fimbriimonas ginsengisoli Gsoil 348]
MTIDEQLAILRRGTTEIISEADLRKKLEKGVPLRVKLGVDPTAKSVTLGWAVVLRKLRDFQRLGHQAVLVIGDFTAQIGDPSGKNKTRPQLTREDVQANVDAVLNQIDMILDRSKTEIVFNKDWLGKMTFEDVIKLCSRYTVARILERDDFTKRLAEQRPIAMHEILYPLCQGMDSVEIVADVEIGGNDQKFNNLVGRTLMEQYGQEAQVVVLCPLLVGLDGKEKMSQSLGNFIGVRDTPNDMFGKTMSIPDDIISNYFELATDVPMLEVHEMLAPGKNPRDAKVHLAKEIVRAYHGDEAAEAAEQYFIDTFSKRQQPVEAEEAAIPPEAIEDGHVAVPAMLVALGMAKSNGAAKDLVKAGAVSVDGEKLLDLRVPAEAIRGKVLKVGKHQFKRLS